MCCQHLEIVLALGVQASALCPCLFQLAIECVDGLCPLLQYQFELGGVACFVFDLAAQANDGGWELVDMPLQLLKIAWPLLEKIRSFCTKKDFLR